MKNLSRKALGGAAPVLLAAGLLAASGLYSIAANDLRSTPSLSLRGGSHAWLTMAGTGLIAPACGSSVPTCTPPQVIDTNSNTCVTPLPISSGPGSGSGGGSGPVGSSAPPTCTANGSIGATTIYEGATVSIECLPTPPACTANGNPLPLTATPALTTTYAISCDNGSATQVLVTVVPVDITLDATPNRVHSGSTSTLTWSTHGATSCLLTGPGVSASGITGSIATPPITAPTLYTLTCQTPAGQRSATATVGLYPSVKEI